MKFKNFKIENIEYYVKPIINAVRFKGDSNQIIKNIVKSHGNKLTGTSTLNIMEELSLAIKNALAYYDIGQVVYVFFYAQEIVMFLKEYYSDTEIVSNNIHEIIPILLMCSVDVESKSTLDGNIDEYFTKNISYIVNLCFILSNLIKNHDMSLNHLENYSLNDVLSSNIYPRQYENFYDKDYLLMNGAEKPEERVFKHKEVENYWKREGINDKKIEDELNDFFYSNYKFKLKDIIEFEDYLIEMKDTLVLTIPKNGCDIKKSYLRIIDFFSFKIVKNTHFLRDKIEILNFYELHPVFEDAENYIFGIAQLFSILAVFRNMIYSGDNQLFYYMDIEGVKAEGLSGHISTYCERRALYLLAEILYDSGYIMPTLEYFDVNNDCTVKIPIPDVAKVEEFGLNKTQFDSDLFFADNKRKIIYNIDLKCLNIFPSIKLTMTKSEIKMNKYITKLQKKHEYINNNPELVKKLLKIDDVSQYKLVSGICTLRSNYYCYCKMIDPALSSASYSNWFKLLENIKNGIELFTW